MTLSNNVTVYGNVPSNQIQETTTSDVFKLTGLIYPIPTDPKNGYFSKSSNVSLIKSNLKSLIKTIRGERFMRPDYGCNLKRFLMEPLDETLFNMIKEEIVISIRRYLRTVSIEKIQVFETRDSELKVNLYCTIKDASLTSFDIGVKV
jgi:phage baseplate assembly protein W